ncbi:MAG: DEAD/DEAH box helicase [Lawsonibacter sp.]
MDILIATPGRLMDLHDQGFVSLDELEVFVLDEADRMLDMGFIHDVKKILKWLPRQKQTLLFSATMPPEIGSGQLPAARPRPGGGGPHLLPGGGHPASRSIWWTRPTRPGCWPI